MAHNIAFAAHTHTLCQRRRNHVHSIELGSVNFNELSIDGRIDRAIRLVQFNNPTRFAETAYDVVARVLACPHLLCVYLAVRHSDA